MNNKNAPEARTIRHPALRALGYAALVLLAVVLLAAAAVTYVVNSPALLKPVVEQVVTSLTDRPFFIRGDFDFDLGPELVVEASDIEWLNPDWSDRPLMMRIGQARIGLELASLRNLPVKLTFAQVSDADLVFEWTDNGDINWLLGKPKDPDAPPWDRQPIPLVLNSARVSDIRLLFDHPSLTQPLPVNITSASHQQDDANRLIVTGDVQVDQSPLKAAVTIGPFQNLIVAGAIDFDIDIAGSMAELSARGKFDDLLELAGAEFDVRSKAPDTEAVLKLLKLPAVTTGPLDLNARLQSDGRNLDAAAQGQIGEFTVNGTARTADRTTLADLHVNLDSSGPDAGTVAAVLGLDGLPNTPYDLKVSAFTDNKGLTIKDLALSLSNTQLNGSGLLPKPPSMADADIQLTVSGRNLADFQGLTTAVRFPAAPFSGKASLAGNGEGIADSLQGDFSVANMRASVSAKLTERDDLDGSVIEYGLNFPSLVQLGNLVGIQFLREGSLKLVGEAQVKGDVLELIQTTASLGDNRAGIAGRIGAEEPITLTVEATGNDLADLTSYFVASEPVPPLPFELSTDVRFKQPRLDVTRLDGKLGSSKVRADGTLVLGNDVPTTTLTLHAEGPDLDELLHRYAQRENLQDDFRIDTRLLLSPEGAELQDLSFKIGGGTISGRIVSGWPAAPEKLRVDVKAIGKNLRNIVPPVSQYVAAEVPFNFDLHGDLDGQVIDMERIELNVGGARIDLSGKLQLDPLAAEGVTFSAQGDRFADLGTLEGWDVNDIPFRASGSMTGNQDKASIRDLTVKLGPNDVSGSVLIDVTDKPRIDVDLTSNYIQLGAVLNRSTEEASPAKAPQAEPAQQERRRLLIPDDPLPFDQLDVLNGEFKVSIKELVDDKTQLTDIIMDAGLQDGALEIRRLHGNSDNGYVDLKLKLEPRDEKYGITTTLTARNLPLTLFNLSASTSSLYRGHRIDWHLTSEGRTLHEWASVLNGFVWVRADNRQIENVRFSALFGDFLSEVLQTVNPFARSEPVTTIECERIFFEIKDGHMETTPTFLIRTDKVNIVAGGSINLPDERISFGVSTSARTGIGLSASDLINPFLRIEGTLLRPRLTIDPTGTLIEGTAAYMTMGLSIIAKSLYKRWLAPGAPCSRYTEQARKVRTEIDPEHVPAD